MVGALGPGASPSALLECIGHWKRASTINKRVRSRRRSSQYFKLTYGRPWPADLSMVLGWLRMLRDEFSWSALQSGAEALTFMERAGGVPEDARFGANPAVASLLKEAALACKQDTRPTKKAPPTPWYLLYCSSALL